MSFNNLIFLFLFLPISVIITRVLPRPFKNIFLVLISLLFYAWGQPSNLIFLICSIGFNYFAGIELGKKMPAKTKFIIFATSVGANILLLAYCKYLSGSMPPGISFYTFTVISYLADVYTKRAPYTLNPVDYILYISFFPKLTMGPIVTYADMRKQLEDHPVTFEGLTNGLQLFLFGLFKKVLIADTMGTAFAQVTAESSMSSLSAWLGMIFYGLELYLDFSGYSDMAIGLSSMFGFKIGKNFDYPYIATSVAEFWRKWHISLGNWFKQYVYFPLGGSRVPFYRIILNTAIVWILTGIWHGNTMNFVVWGLYHGAFVVLDRFILNRIMKYVPTWLRAVLTVIVVFFGWVFFFNPSFDAAIAYFGKMFGADGLGVADNAALYCLFSNLAALVIAILVSTPLPYKIYESVFIKNVLGGSKIVMTTAAVVINLLLLGLTVAALVTKTYSTFLYAQF